MLSKGLFSVSQNAADLDLIVIRKNNVVVGSKKIRISAIRAYLVGFETAQYTLNAAIRIALFVSKSAGFSYQVPTDLAGTEADDIQIIPNNIALGIVLLQADKGVTVDGVPGADFIRKVMGLHKDILIAAHCRAAFMDETSNKHSVTPDGKPIVLPDFKADENAAYDFLKNITLARNGLWSVRPNIVNLTGVRLEKGTTNIQWDDTIGACWIGADGKKKAKIYTATTEPGNRKIFKTLLAQTILFIPGYHQGKLPAMRGHRTVTFVPTNLYPERFLFNTNDARGLNLHPGGSTGAMLNLVKYILPVGATNEVEFKAVLVFMEIFKILSRWGIDPKRPAWENLVGWAAAKALRAGPVTSGLVKVFQDEKMQPVKQISVLAARGWLAQKWSSNRANLLKIIRSVDPMFVVPSNFSTLTIKGLEQLITDKHIEGIIRRQCDYFFDPVDVDGLAGNTFLSLINTALPADGAMAQQANTDFAAMSALFQLFGGSNPVLTIKRRDYVKQIRTQTLEERAKLLESEEKKALESSGQKVRETVGTWSILCQVVFGPEMFYEMMDFTVGLSLQTGQRRWYYTLVEEASIPK